MRYYVTIKDINTPIIKLKKNTIFEFNSDGFYIINDASKTNYSFLNMRDTDVFKEFVHPESEFKVGDIVHFKNDECAIYIVEKVNLAFSRNKPYMTVNLRIANPGKLHDRKHMENVYITDITRHITYWFITSEGSVAECLNTPKFKNATEFRIKIGNFFRTKMEACAKLNQLIYE